MEHVVVATDRSPTAERAVAWAARVAGWADADLSLIQVLPPELPAEPDARISGDGKVAAAASDLERLALEIAGSRGHAHVAVDADPASAIVHYAEDVGADLLVVGNAGMSGRREFLLANVPNRVSHNATCSVVIVNTMAGSGPVTLQRRREEELEREEEPPPLMGRAAHIAAVMAKHGIAELFSRSRSRGDLQASARRLRAALEELGPTFCKLGQVLSTRPDLLPAPYIEECATLQDHVPPMSEERVVRVMEEELGVPWEDVFESIEPEPMASGTIAQVHRATLTGGERVVIKVQRLGAQDEIMRDLGLLELFAAKAIKRPALTGIVDFGAVFEHLSTSLQRELDFCNEASNLQRLGDALTDYSRLAVPRLYGDYTSKRLLVMEEIQGSPIRHAPHGEPRKEAARQLLESYYRQILTEGFFHADPHPGNLLWWNDRIYFLDFGMIGELGPEMRHELILLLLAFWQEDVSFLTDVTLMIAGEDQRPDIDVSEFREEIGRLMTRYRHLSLKDIQLGPILQEMMEISLRHGVPLPASLALTAKAMAQMQLATAQLDPDLDPFAVAGTYLGRSMLEKLRAGADLQTLFYRSQKMGVRLIRLVESLERLTGARPGPKLQVHFRGVEGLETNIRRAGRRLSIALAAVGAFVTTGITAASTTVSPVIPQVFGATGGALLAGLLVDLLRRRR